MNILDSVVLTHNIYGGSTTKLSSGQVNKGFVVSTHKDKEVKRKSKKIKRGQVAKYILDNLSMLTKRANCLGTWYDNDSKNTYLDVCKVYKSRQYALSQGRRYRQKAIYDLSTGNTINVN